MKTGYYLVGAGCVGDISLAQSCQVWWKALTLDEQKAHLGAKATVVREDDGEDVLILELVPLGEVRWRYKRSEDPWRLQHE